MSLTLKKLKYLQPLSKQEFDNLMASDGQYLTLKAEDARATTEYKNLMKEIAQAKKDKNSTPDSIKQYNKLVDHIEQMRQKLRRAERDAVNMAKMVEFSIEEHRIKTAMTLDRLHRQMHMTSRKMTLAKNRLSTYEAEQYRTLAKARLVEKRK
jgi:hypothetical protein